MLSDRQIIEGCFGHKRRAQQMLYDKYSALLLGVSLRYAGNRQEAEDILQDSFMRIFTNIKEFLFSTSPGPAAFNEVRFQGTIFL